MKIDTSKILGFIFLIFLLVVLGMFVIHVSIGGKIAKEIYETDGIVDYDNWFWNIGIFLAIMAGFCYFLDMSLNLLNLKKEKFKYD